VQAGRFGIQRPDPQRKDDAERWMRYDPVYLTPPQRSVVEQAIVDHCQIRTWHLHAKNARTNHIHVVVTSVAEPETTRDQLKSWASRRLNKAFGKRAVWWTVKGSVRQIWTELQLENAIRYVLDCQ
jgi:REP element-mobilizing transposase RayT